MSGTTPESREDAMAANYLLLLADCIASHKKSLESQRPPQGPEKPHVSTNGSSREGTGDAYPPPENRDPKLEAAAARIVPASFSNLYNEGQEEAMSDVDGTCNVLEEFDDKVPLEAEDEFVETEEELLKVLKEKATRLKKDVLRKWRTGKKKPQRFQSSGNKGSMKCTYRNCGYHASRYHDLCRHMVAHYPDAYFCPSCEKTFRLSSSFDGHFRRTECIESIDARRFEVARDKERFNIYYLGVMEDYRMPEEHFEMIAGRRRERN